MLKKLLQILKKPNDFSSVATTRDHLYFLLDRRGEVLKVIDIFITGERGIFNIVGCLLLAGGAAGVNDCASFVL